MWAWVIGTKAGRILAGSVAIIAMLGLVYLKGYSDGKQSAVAKQKEADDAARKRIEAVEPATPDSVIRSLREGTF